MTTDDTRSPPDLVDAVLLIGGVGFAFVADVLVLSTSMALNMVALLLVSWLFITTASGAYPWSMRSFGGWQ